MKKKYIHDPIKNKNAQSTPGQECYNKLKKIHQFMKWEIRNDGLHYFTCIKSQKQKTINGKQNVNLFLLFEF